MIFNLSETSHIANQYIGQLRDIQIQSDRMRFRANLERIGMALGYELSKQLAYRTREVETPLGSCIMHEPQEDIVLGAILRAALPMHAGLLRVFDQADNAFVSAYRQHHKDGTFEVKMDYISCPNLDGKTLIVADPMLATGASMVLTLKSLLEYGSPSSIHVVTGIAARDGLHYFQRYFSGADVWLGAIDEELTARSYIVPGLGDAGDLAYGAKLQD